MSEPTLHSIIDLYALLPSKLNNLYNILTSLKDCFRGIVLVSDIFPTVFSSSLLRNVVPVFGSLVLNESVGGFNLKALQHALELGARLIVMPTIDAWNYRHRMGLSGGLSIYTTKGELLREVDTMISYIMEHNAILATGYLSFGEVKALVKEANAIGLKSIIVSDVVSDVNLMTIKQQRHLIELGAFLEYRISSLSSNEALRIFHRAVEELDINHIVVSSGIPLDKNYSSTWIAFIKKLSDIGLKDEIIEMLVFTNPSRLLGLS